MILLIERSLIITFVWFFKKLGSVDSAKTTSLPFRLIRNKKIKTGWG